MISLRPYQSDVVEQFGGAVAGGERRVILVAPTGSAKTVIFCEIIRRGVALGQRALVLSHRREIIAQTSNKLAACAIDDGIIAAGAESHSEGPVQVASIGTLYGRALRRKVIEIPPAELLVIDEAHHVTARTYRAIIESYPGAALIGATATPCRGDGRGLCGIFNKMIETPQVPELIEQGYLVGTRVYAPVQPDLHGVEVNNGIGPLRNSPSAWIVLSWSATSSRTGTAWPKASKTVVFAISVQHSVHIRDEFRKTGVSCEHLDGSTEKDERDAILKMLECGAIDVVTNCMVLTEGWDMPEVGCCVLARPTRKMGLYRQMIGRVLRPATDKPDAVVIDHSARCTVTASSRIAFTGSSTRIATRRIRRTPAAAKLTSIHA
jgi:superfamily II DNA or RNA helicase